MIITKNNLYSFRYKKKQNEEVEKPRVRQIEIKVCTGYLDCGKAVYDWLQKVLKKLGDQTKLETTLHSGFDSIVEKMHDKSGIDESWHDGFHGISEN